MNRFHLWRKYFAVSIILLFIGIAISPAINYSTVKAAADNDTVEVTTQACGIRGYGNTTVKLTRQQYQNLEQYLTEFRARLNQTTTREEAVPIFKEAVFELNKYGLLPKGMSVKRAQKLVIGLAQNNRLMQYVEKKLKTSSIQEGNQFCLIYGKAEDETYFEGPVSRLIDNILCRLAYLFFNQYGNFQAAYTLLFLLSIHSLFTIGLLSVLGDLPCLGSVIYYGGYGGMPMAAHYFSTQGNIWTIGWNGIKNWNGYFYGGLSIQALEIYFLELFPGVNGFTGLRVHLFSAEYYFGFAFNVNISYSPPPLC
jgi:hypothetical protein